MKNKKKRKRLIIIGVILLLLVLFVIWFIGQSKQAVDSLYSTAIVERGDLDIYYSFSGNTQIDDVQNIVSTQSWKIEEIKVKEGDRIRKGDVLYVINEEDYNLAIANAQIAVETAQLGVSSTEASMSQQLSQALGSMNQAKLSRDDAERTYNNTKALYEAGMTSQQTYNQAKMAYDVAVEQYNTASVAYQTLVNTSDTSVASSQAQLSQAQTSYDTLVKQIGDREVKAEIDGVVSKIYVDEDTKLSTGSIVMDILDTDSVNAVVKVDEYDYATMLVGNPVTVYIDALNMEVPGIVSSIDMQAVAAAGMAYFNAEVEFEHDSSVLGGLTVEVTSLKDSAKDALLIPMDAIQFDKQNQPYVLYKDEKGVLQSRYVTVGINDGFKAEIIEGVSEGETLYYIDNSFYNQLMSMQTGGY
ncbi:MAG: HlyD family efflux transporter periplasmic adaptor subunit, partial [Lachnospiraceae bacterium]|nr:HlyD family efflux transporter periplasmic adaptor subunit [Lachnospiraceae bacterium]